jgi:hypothetical protein
VFEQSTQRHRGRSERYPHGVGVKPATLPGERSADPLQCAVKGLKLVSSGRKFASEIGACHRGTIVCRRLTRRPARLAWPLPSGVFAEDRRGLEAATRVVLARRLVPLSAVRVTGLP